MHDFAHRLDLIDRAKRRWETRGFVWGCATATAVHLLVALWVRAGGAA